MIEVALLIARNDARAILARCTTMECEGAGGGRSFLSTIGLADVEVGRQGAGRPKLVAAADLVRGVGHGPGAEHEASDCGMWTIVTVACPYELGLMCGEMVTGPSRWSHRRRR